MELYVVDLTTPNKSFSEHYENARRVICFFAYPKDKEFCLKLFLLNLKIPEDLELNL